MHLAKSVKLDLNRGRSSLRDRMGAEPCNLLPPRWSVRVITVRPGKEGLYLAED